MTATEQLWAWLEQTGACSGNPRPRFKPQVERVLQEEAEEEIASGEKEPDAAPELPRNVRLAQHDQARCLLYAIESLLADGFWGVGVAELGELLRQPLPWALVLLQPGELRGYWLTDVKVKELWPHWQRIVPDGPHYKLSAPEDLEQATQFASTENLKLLLEHLWAKA